MILGREGGGGGGGGGGCLRGAGIKKETISRFLTSKGLGLQRYW